MNFYKQKEEKQTQTTSQKLLSESVEIIDAYSQTVGRLESVNERISVEESIIEARILSLEEDKKFLSTQRNRNSQIINNINEILNE